MRNSSSLDEMTSAGQVRQAVEVRVRVHELAQLGEAIAVELAGDVLLVVVARAHVHPLYARNRFPCRFAASSAIGTIAFTVPTAPTVHVV